MQDEKYVVFKREEFIERHGTGKLCEALEDAVVIRTQDIFAAPALDGYANGIRVALSIFEGLEVLPEQQEESDRWLGLLGDISDYFHQRAAEAWQRTDKKLPD